MIPIYSKCLNLTKLNIKCTTILKQFTQNHVYIIILSQK